MNNRNVYTLLLHFGSPPNNPRNSTGGSCFRCTQADTGIITNTRRITDCATQGSCELLLARMRSPKPLTVVRCHQLAPGQGSPKQMPLGEALPTLRVRNIGVDVEGFDYPLAHGFSQRGHAH